MGRRAKRRGKISGTVVRVGKAGPQVIESRGLRWTDAHEARFLDALSVSCNVTRAARAVGFSTVAIYNRRRRDGGFAERWQTALAQGYAHVEAGLVCRAIEVVDGTAPAPVPHGGPAIEAMTFKEAAALLKMHKLAVLGEGKPRGRAPRPRSFEEVRASILTKLLAIEAARASGASPDDVG
jgi:hypothetical protein